MWPADRAVLACVVRGAAKVEFRETTSNVPSASAECPPSRAMASVLHAAPSADAMLEAYQLKPPATNAAGEPIYNELGGQPV